jgi:hypothetical protein
MWSYLKVRRLFKKTLPIYFSFIIYKRTFGFNQTNNLILRNMQRDQEVGSLGGKEDKKGKDIS